MDPDVKKEPDARPKDRLIEAGVVVFGRYSYEGATTRMIAREAGVNIAAIPYYFDGKEGLYHAVVKHIIKRLQAVVWPTLKMTGERAEEENLAPQEAASLVEALLGKMVDFMVGTPEATQFARIVLREQLFPSSAYDIIFNQMMFPLIKGVAAMVSAATGKPLSDVMMIRALAFIGQIIAFRVAREAMVRVLDFTAYSAEETETIRRVVLEQTRGAIEIISRA